MAKDLWLRPSVESEKKTSHEYVTDLKKRLLKGCRLARKNIEKQMIKSKKRYDSKSKHRSFSSGDLVLLLWQCGTNKFNLEWKGPYEVIRPLAGSKANYIINIDGKEKTYHVNMLQEYVERPQNLVPEVETVSNVSIIVETEEECETDSFSTIELPSLKQTESVADVRVNPELTENQKDEVENLLSIFSDIFTDIPSQTNCIEHEIELTSEEPVKLKPYPLPFSSEPIVKD